MDSMLGFFQITSFTIRDVIDIGLVTFVIYRFLLLMRGTRGVQMTFGIVILLLFYVVTRFYRLASVQWLLSNLLTYIVFAIIVLYQNEIRRVLADMGKTSIWDRQRRQASNGFEEIILAATTLASKRIGGLIVIERDIGLKNYVESGIALDAVLTYDLLVTIFSPTTPMHDGAVIVRRNRILAAGCFLPLTMDPHLSKELGTRHRAAIGVTEETDAVAVIISEETGTISLSLGGEIARDLNSASLRTALPDIVESRSDFLPPGIASHHPESV